MNMELRLLHSAFEKEVYDEVKDIFDATSFNDELEDIASVIADCHSQFESDLDIDIVQQSLFDRL